MATNADGAGESGFTTSSVFGRGAGGASPDQAPAFGSAGNIAVSESAFAPGVAGLVEGERVAQVGDADLEDSVAEAEEAPEVAQQMAAPEPEEASGEELYRAGEQRFQAGAYNESLKRFNELKDKSDARFSDAAQLGVARSLHRLGRLDEAARAYEASLRQRSTGSQARTAALELAAIYQQQGKRQDAVRVLQRFLKRSPDDLQVLQALERYTAGESKAARKARRRRPARAKKPSPSKARFSYDESLEGAAAEEAPAAAPSTAEDAAFMMQ